MTTLIAGDPNAANKGAQPSYRALALAGVGLICLLFMLLTGRDGLFNLYERWRYEEEYGYGFLIVLLVPLLLWGRREALLRSENGTQWPGLAILVLAQLCIVLAALGESYFVEQIALVASLFGL